MVNTTNQSIPESRLTWPSTSQFGRKSIKGNALILSNGKSGEFKNKNKIYI